jgi:hypothetical protein
LDRPRHSSQYGDPGGTSEPSLTPLELLDRLALVPPSPSIHRHRYTGALVWTALTGNFGGDRERPELADLGRSRQRRSDSGCQINSALRHLNPVGHLAKLVVLRLPQLPNEGLRLVQQLAREWSSAGSQRICDSVKQRGSVVVPACAEPRREHAKGCERHLTLAVFERSHGALQLEVRSTTAVLLLIASMVEVREQARHYVR